MTIDVSCLPGSVTVAAGQASAIPLPCYADSGNAWSAVCLGGQGVARVSVELGEPPATADDCGDGTAPPPAMSLVPEHAVVRGLRPGSARWLLVLARSFGPRQVAARHELQVTVVASA